MLSLELATALREAGLAWKPAPGDRFAIPDRGLDEETFVLSNMTIEVHEFPDGPVIGFNGTVEWALDDVDKDEAIWLPGENQLRSLLGGTFRRLERVDDGYQVVTSVLDHEERFTADAPEDAYARALLALIAAGRD